MIQGKEEEWLWAVSQRFHVEEGEGFPFIFWPEPSRQRIIITDKIAFSDGKTQGTLYVSQGAVCLETSTEAYAPTMPHLFDLVTYALRSIHALHGPDLPGTPPTILFLS